MCSWKYSSLVLLEGDTDEVVFYSAQVLFVEVPPVLVLATAKGGIFVKHESTDASSGFSRLLNDGNIDPTLE